MELNCPRCGSPVEAAGSRDAAAVCPNCAAAVEDAPRVPARARRAQGYDGYAVGGRVLKIAPGWLLLSLAAFVLIFLFFGWLSRPVTVKKDAAGEDFRNEMTNRPPAPAQNGRRAARESKAATDARPRAEAGRGEEATPEDEGGAAEGEGDGGASEADAFAVQVGAFADRSHANELVSRLRAAGFEARVVEAGAEKRFRYQVRSGRFETREEAARLASQIRAKGVAGDTVIVEPKESEQ